MYYCKDIMSLSVLSLYEGELLGVVDKLYFDKKMKKLCEIQLLNESGARFILPTKKIFHIGKNAITIKNNQAVQMREVENEFCVAPIQTKAYSITGEFLGVVQEIALNEKFLTENILLDNGSVLKSFDIASLGKSAVVFYNNNKLNVNQFSPKQPKAFKRKVVQIAKILPKETEVAVQPVKTETKQVVLQNPNFLIGRVCTKDIFNFNNELLIKAHSVVNKKNLKEINKFGKLKELMLYSK